MNVPKRAIVLSAGLGTRMRPITDRIPKPLVTVAGRTLLDRCLDRLDASGVESVVVNTFHFAELIERHIAGRRRPRIVISREVELLDTGGGVAKALPDLLPDPFFAINSDALWLDGARDTLERLADAWNDARTDALLLVKPVGQAVGYEGKGDFHMAADGRLSRRAEGGHAPFLYIGLQILSPRLFAGMAVEKYSLNRLYDRAAASGRLHGLAHEGAYFHVGTPDSIALAERGMALLADGDAG
jgi:N-acetyl-alpha-D-muramate 1-phosphate uridylyltransferase